MVNIKELYLMNLALDGHDVFTLPSFKSVHMTRVLADAVYDSLVMKGFMQNPDTFTPEGAKFLKNVDDFKTAKKYVKIGSAVIGIYKEHQAVFLFRNLIKDEYDFCRVQLEDVIDQLTPTYPFLSFKDSGTDVSIENDKVSYEDLIKKYSLKFDNTIYLSTLDIKILREQKKDMVTNEILFYYNNHCYCYDRNNEKLSTCSVTEAQDLLKKRVAI